MKLVFVSNMLNHHQVSLCEAFQKEFNEFYFITTESNSKIGYQKSQLADFVVPYYMDEYKREAVKHIMTADVVIFGSCPDSLIQTRMEKNKLSFLYSERFFKKGTWRRLIPTTKKAVMNRIGQYKDKEMYVLCASAYLSYDLSLLGFPAEKCFKWGYFPVAKKYDTEILLKNKKSSKPRILWVGRMLKWKHPEMALKLADKLRCSGYCFELIMVGDGDQMEAVRKLVNKKQLGGYVYLYGSQNVEKVRKYMEKSDIFIATSDFYEGWGAVLNEAMNSGCAVIASHAAGATPYLIRDGVNGYIFESGNVDMLFEKIKKCLENNNHRYELQLQAYKSIENVWNASNAAKNFKNLVDNIMKKNENGVIEGPCSSAPLLKNKWYKE